MPYIIGSGVSPNKSFTDIPETRTASLNMSDNIIEQVKLKDWSEAKNTATSSSGVITLDMSLGNVFITQLTENITSVIINNPPPSGVQSTLTWIVTQDSTARTINFPANKVWASKLVPTISTIGATYIFNLKTTDGGSGWIISSEGGVGTPPPNAPSSLTLSLPSQFVINVSAQLDVTVGNDGGDSNLSYAWQISLDNGSNWITTGLSNSNIKNPTMTFTSTYAAVKARVTVSNGGGATISTSSSLAVVATVVDSDSEFLDTSTHTLSNPSYTSSIVNGTTISVPIELTFNNPVNFTGNSSVHSITKLNSTQVIISFRDNANSQYGTAIVGTISGNSISFGSKYVYNSGNTTYSRVSALNLTQFVISYTTSSGYGVVGTVSGTSISFGTPVQFAAIAYESSISTINSTQVVIAYRGNTDEGVAIVGTISGTSISFGPPVNFLSAVNYPYITSIGPDQIVIATRGVSGYGTSIVGTISGTSISFGTPVIFNSANCNDTSITKINSAQVAIVYRDDGNLGYGTAVIGTVSGTSISFGSEFIFKSSSIQFSMVSSSNPNQISVVFVDATGSFNAVVVEGTISGTSISFSSSYVYRGTYCERVDIVNIDSTRSIITGTTTSYGTANILTNVIRFNQNDKIRISGKVDTVSSVAINGTNQEITLVTGPSSVGTVYNLSQNYTVPQVSQQGGQNPFQQMDLEVQWTRNKFNVTTSGSDVVINHGVDNIQPFNVSDKVVVSGTTDVVTTISNISRGSVAGTGNLLLGSPVTTGTFILYNDPQLTKISENKFACFTNNQKIVIGEIQGDSIVWGLEYSFPANFAIYGARMTSDGVSRLFISFKDSINAYGSFVAAIVSGSVITFGNIITLMDVYSSVITPIYIGNNRVLSLFRRNSNGYGNFNIISVNGNSSTNDSSIPLSLDVTDDSSLCLIETDKFVFFRGTPGSGNVSVGTITGNSISFGTEVYQGDRPFYYMKSVKIDTNKILLCATPSNPFAQIWTVSGTSVSAGSKVDFPYDGTSSIVTDLAKISSTKAIFSYMYSTTQIGYSFLLNTSGTTITIDQESIYGSSPTSLARFGMINIGQKTKILYTTNSELNLYCRDLTYDGTNYTSTITPASLPTSPATIELLPIQLQGDLDSGTPTYQDLSETYSVVNSTTAKCVATLTDSGMKADIKLISTNSDFNNLIISRINATFRN